MQVCLHVSVDLKGKVCRWQVRVSESDSTIFTEPMSIYTSWESGCVCPCPVRMSLWKPWKLKYDVHSEFLPSKKEVTG